MLLGLGIATILNVALNFREYSIKSAVEKATMTAAIVKDGLTAHIVNDIMDKRQYFLNQIASNNNKIKALWIVRSKHVIKQFGKGFKNETIRDALDKEVLKSGNIAKKIHESADGITLRVSIPYKATDANPNCLKCYNVQIGDTLGIISMQFDITNMRNAGMLTIIKILGINLVFIVFVLLLLNHYITPYMQLFGSMQEGIKKAYSGDFTYKFTTEVKGAEKNIVTQLNTLFAKMQDTFGEIKYNLATFIPQGCVSSADPLYEAKTIIKELSDIYKFKKTIELDTTKEVVYSRFTDILAHKYGLNNIILYEVDAQKNKRHLIFKSNDALPCNVKVNNNAILCRAYRTKSDVISSEFINLCKECVEDFQDYICIPFDINDEYSLVLYLIADDATHLNTMHNHIPSIKNYLEAAKPVIESKLLMAKLRDTALKDGMTKLYNRRFLEEFIDTVMAQVKRDNETYHIFMIDIDFFKSVNDTYGHDVGDTIITAIGELLLKNTRESDLAIRYGGEEFVLLLHNATDEGALKVAQTIKQQFSEIGFNVGEKEALHKTMSIGISKFPKDAPSIWKCIKYADNAMYVAKTTGRDKIVFYEPTMDEDENLR